MEIRRARGGSQKGDIIIIIINILSYYLIALLK